MSPRRASRWAVAAAFCWAVAPRGGFAISAGELDDFSASLDGWRQGQPATATAGVFLEPNGGLAGNGDGFLRLVADASSSHGKLVALNNAGPWGGDYLAAGITKITLSAKNFSATPVSLRIGLGSVQSANAGTWFVTAQPLSLPANADWTALEFSLAESDLQRTNGTGTYAATAAAVHTLRILHNSVADANGSFITATIGLDNIFAFAPLVIPGDFDGDGMVDGDDLVQWEGDFGLNPDSDATGDQETDGADLLLWQQHLGEMTATPIGAAVPEPQGFSLLAIAAALGKAIQRGKGGLSRHLDALKTPARG